MSIFRWTAPLFKLAGRRWTQDDFSALAARLRPSVGAGSVFADLGGGTGDLGLGIARALEAQVVVIDPTPQALRLVDADPLVSTRLAGAENLPFPAGYFDGLLCCDAFHHLRDQHAAATEIARVVRPGGVVLLLDYAPVEPLRLLVRFERLLGEPAAFMTMNEMQDFMGGHGIEGNCEAQRRGYLFLGRVKP